jgi:transcriptional regulator GlxA family with amidase domain
MEGRAKSAPDRNRAPIAFTTRWRGSSNHSALPVRCATDGLKLSRRVTSICTGAFILAEAGLLDGRRATTHWFYAQEFQRRFPNVKLEDDRIFIIDGPAWTSAGATAGLDLALAMVEKDLGAEASRSVAKKLVMHHRRAAVSPNIPNCLPCRRNQTAFKTRCPMLRKILVPLCRSTNWLRRQT